jgi:predicted enzyme related to lactoylglutathione lyase
MRETSTELVLHVEHQPFEVDLLVDSADVAAAQWVTAGGSIVVPPFDIPIGQCVVVQGPWGTALVLLDMQSGRLQTDDDGRVIGVGGA